MLQALPQRLIGTRDRAILLLGFAGAFRRSELVGLDVRDLEFCPEGLRVTLRRSKTDQEGVGRTVGIPLQPRPLDVPGRGDAGLAQRRRDHRRASLPRGPGLEPGRPGAGGEPGWSGPS